MLNCGGILACLEANTGGAALAIAYLGLKNDAQVANGMVTGCLRNASTWTLAHMRKADQSEGEMVFR